MGRVLSAGQVGYQLGSGWIFETNKPTTQQHQPSSSATSARCRLGSANLPIVSLPNAVWPGSKRERKDEREREWCSADLRVVVCCRP